jgi:hypothetical protein
VAAAKSAATLRIGHPAFTQDKSGVTLINKPARRQSRMNHKRWIAILLVMLVGLFLTACGGGEPVVVEDREAFDAAVEQYLRSKSMELAISEYISFEMDEAGDAVTAVIALKYAGEGVAPVQTRYEFTFEKTNDRWQVAWARKAR